MPSCLGSLLWHFRDQRCVHAHRTKIGGPPGRAKRDRPAGKRLVKEGGVVGQMLSLVVRQVDLVVNRVDPASRFAGTAIHTLIWVDIHGPCTFVDAVDRAFPNTGLIHHINARSADYIGHDIEVNGAQV